MSRLFLVTRRFPYSPGEEFIANEIEHLSRLPCEITIVPSMPGGDVRSLPPRIKLDTSYLRELGGRRRPRWRRLGHLMPCVNDMRRIGYSALRRDALLRTMEWYLQADTFRRWIAKRVPSQDPVLVYCYWLLGPALGAARARRRGFRVIARAHGADLYAARHDPEYMPFQAATLRMIDRVFTISDHGRRYLADEYPQYREKYAVSRLGVSDPGFTARQSDDGVVRIVSCSYLSPVKRVDRIALAIRTFCQQRPRTEVRWDHLGGGDERERVESVVARDTPRNMRWRLHGSVANSDVLSFYRDQPVDLFINLSEAEGIPVTFMEAQSCGIPIVATDVGGVSEIVDDSNGVLVGADDELETIAAAMATLADKSTNSRRRREARRSWSEKFDSRSNYDEFHRELSRLMQPVGASI